MRGKDKDKTEMPSLIGKRWHVCKKLGAGAMGRVFLAEGDAAELVVVKLLTLPADRAHDLQIERFKSEFSILKDISHPGINRVYDLGWDEARGTYFFTTEYIDGVPFLEAVKGRGIDDIEELFVQVLRALGYLHGHGIVHGDIKSANVLVEGSEAGGLRTRLIDFGLAALEGLRTTVGTPAYLAPEVILKERWDGRADLYSLGVLIYTALAGLNPFKAGSLDEVISRHLHLRPPPPSSHNPSVPAYLDEVVTNLLKKNPSERFGTAAHVIRAIGFGSKKDYPIETKETSLGYVPTEGRFIGREEEFSKIKDICLKARDGVKGSPRVLCIEGDMGSGRRRLLSELKYFAQLNDLDVAALEAVDISAVATFGDRIAELMKRPFPAHDASVREVGGRPALVICYGIGPLLTRKDAVSTVQRMRQFVKWLRTECALPRAGMGGRMSFAFSASPDELPVIEHVLGLDEADISRVHIENFGLKETGNYLEALTGIKGVPEGLATWLFEYTQGNPLFITEVTKELIEKGILFDSHGRWRRETLEDIGVHVGKLEIPVSLSGLFEKRYEAMLPGEKAVFETLAIWHRPATLDEVARASDIEGVHGALVSLMREGLVGHDPKAAAYFITNNLLRDVVCERMPEISRERLNRAVIGILEKAGPEAEDDLNWQRAKSGNVKERIDALITLGKMRLGKSQFVEAAADFGDALADSGSAGYRRGEILLHLGEALSLSGKYRDAIGIYSDLAKRQDAIKNTKPEDKVHCRMRLALAYMKEGLVSDARLSLVEAKGILKNSRGGVPLRLKTENLLARCAFLDGKLDEAEAMYKQTKTEWATLPEKDKNVVLNNDLAHVYLQRGELDQALKEFCSDIEFFKTAGAQSELARALYAMAQIKMAKDDSDGAISYFDESIRIARSISDPELLLRAYNGLGGAGSAKGDFEKAVYWYERGMELAARAGEDGATAAIAVNIGLIRLRERDEDGALNYFNSAVNIFERAKRKTSLDLSYLFRAYIELADLYRLKKKFEKSERYLCEAMELAKEMDLTNDESSLMKKVEAMLARGRAEFDRLLEKTTEEEVESALEMGEVSILDVPAGETAEAGPMNEKYYRYILEINKYLAGESDMDFVLKTILKYALELSGAQQGMILLEGEGKGLEVRAHCNFTIDEEVTKVSTGIAQSAIDSDEVIVTNDAGEDLRFKAMDSVMMLGLKSVMCIPIHIRKKAVAVIYLENRAKLSAFADADRGLLTAFADQAGIAIGNARLATDSEEAKQKLSHMLDESQQNLERLSAKLKGHMKELEGRHKFQALISQSPKMEKIFNLLERIADTEISVCITGESGTGKEVIAKAIHYASGRRQGPIVAVNCGAIPVTLIESELFGYKAGAFTGAVRDKIGFFEAANSGTIFLDEIAELDASLQAKLLRAIQEREVIKVGDTKAVKFDARIICATNRNLEESVQKGEFRRDLYYRIAEVRVDLPPLRERQEDIPPLVEEFISDYSKQHGLKKRPVFDQEFLSACVIYNWPGNIRELENTVRLACALSEGGKVSLSLLPDNHVLKTRHGIVSAWAEQPAREDLPFIDAHNRYDPRVTWREYEARIFASAYAHFAFSAKETSKSLNIALTTAYKKIAEQGLKDRKNVLFDARFEYEPTTPLRDYLTKIFEAAWGYSGKSPYRAAKALGVSPGFFYKVMKEFRK